MSIPRQDILDAVAAKLKTIVAGQTVTIPGPEGNSVHTYVSTFDSTNFFELDTADLLAVSKYGVAWQDKNADADDSENGRTLWELDLSLIIIAKQGQTTKARAIAQDLVACLFSDKRLGNRLKTMTVRRLGAPQNERYEQIIGTLELIVTLHYRTKDWQI